MRSRSRSWSIPAAAIAVALLTLAGCSSDDPAGGGDTGGGGDADVAPDPGPGDATEDAEPDADAEPDVPKTPIAIEGVVIAESPATSLAAVVLCDTDLPALVSVEVVEDSSGRAMTVPARGKGATEHEIDVFGLHPESTYTFTVKAVSPDGTAAGEAAPQSFTSGALPDDFPPLHVTVHQPDKVEPGYRFFYANRWKPGLDGLWGLLIIIDDTGQPVWYYQTGLSISDANRLDDGTFAYIFGLFGTTIVDLAGDQLQSWYAQDFDLGAMHHHVSSHPVDKGNLLVVASEAREIDGYPTPEGGTEALWVVGDVIAEISRKGGMVSQFSLFDYFDPMIGPSLPSWDDPFFNIAFAVGGIDHVQDWTHTNAVIVDPSDGNYILSVRHLDTIAKIDPVAGQLVWRLGDGGDFTMAAGGEWQYHQHAVELTPEGNLFLYDNGNYRPTLAAGEIPWTRAVEYKIDEAAMTVEQVWEYRGEEPYFAPHVGDADLLPGGNVLITDGGILSDPLAFEGDPDNGRWARIVEVTHDAPAQPVMTIEVRDTSADPIGYQLYRTVFFESLYTP